MKPTIQKLFDAGAYNYDVQRRSLIPCFDDFYGTAAAWAQTDKKNPRILDLGAGTGLFTAFVKQMYPEAAFTLIDLSEEMLKQARRRFGDDPNVRYIYGDYTSFACEEQYDIVISSLSIHHLTHESKRALFRTVCDLLPPGGIFVNADQAAGTSPYFDKRYREQWLDAVVRSGLDRALIDASIARREHDINAPKADQLAWLREAGFAEADTVYSYNEFTVFFARKGI